MRRRVEEHIPAGVAEREIKLGPGGLRDIEFSVQLLQMVHGRSDVMLRSAATLPSLEGLATWGYVGRADASSLTEAYMFLRHLGGLNKGRPNTTDLEKATEFIKDIMEKL